MQLRPRWFPLVENIFNGGKQLVDLQRLRSVTIHPRLQTNGVSDSESWSFRRQRGLLSWQRLACQLLDESHFFRIIRPSVLAKNVMKPDRRLTSVRFLP